MSQFTTIFFMTLFVAVVTIGYYTKKYFNRRDRKIVRVSKRNQFPNSQNYISYTRDEFFAARRTTPSQNLPQNFNTTTTNSSIHSNIKDESISSQSISETAPIIISPAILSLIRNAGKQPTQPSQKQSGLLGTSQVNLNISPNKQSHANNNRQTSQNQQKLLSSPSSSSSPATNQHAKSPKVSLPRGKSHNNSPQFNSMNGSSSSSSTQTHHNQSSSSKKLTVSKSVSIPLERILEQSNSDLQLHKNNNTSGYSNETNLDSFSLSAPSTSSGENRKFQSNSSTQQMGGSSETNHIQLSESQQNRISDLLKQLLKRETQRNTIPQHEYLKQNSLEILLSKKSITPDEFVEIIEAFSEKRRVQSLMDSGETGDSSDSQDSNLTATQYNKITLLCINLKKKEWADFLLADMQANQVYPDRIVLDEYLNLLSS